MKIISLLNQKGGSGKTTTAINLAAFLAAQNKKTLLIDLDPQGSATKWCGIKDDVLFDTFSLFVKNENNYTIKTNQLNIENKTIKSIIHNRDIKDIDFNLMPASNRMFNLEKILALEVGSELILKKSISMLTPGLFDYVLIDCPPNLGVLSVNAMVASEEIFIPVTAQYMSLAGLLGVLRSMDIVRERLNGRLGMGRILICQYDSRTRHSREVLGMIRERYSSKVFNTVIRTNTRLAEASSFSMPINIYDIKSRGAEDYQALAKEVLNEYEEQKTSR